MAPCSALEVTGSSKITTEVMLGLGARVLATAGEDAVELADSDGNEITLATVGRAS